MAENFELMPIFILMITWQFAQKIKEKERFIHKLTFNGSISNSFAGKKIKFIKEETGQVILRRPAIIFFYKIGKSKSNRLFRFTKEILHMLFPYILTDVTYIHNTTQHKFISYIKKYRGVT